jgi:hypothetical protein
MNWTNLLSGLIGAVVGGLLAILAAFITMKQQRSLALAAAEEERRQSRVTAARNACIEILGCMLTIRDGLLGLATKEEDSPAAIAARVALDRLVTIHIALIQGEPELRDRLRSIMNVLDEWREYWQDDSTKKDENRQLIVDYMRYLAESIRAYLDNDALPSKQDPPHLRH